MELEKPVLLTPEQLEKIKNNLSCIYADAYALHKEMSDKPELHPDHSLKALALKHSPAATYKKIINKLFEDNNVMATALVRINPKDDHSVIALYNGHPTEASRPPLLSPDQFKQLVDALNLKNLENMIIKAYEGNFISQPEGTPPRLQTIAGAKEDVVDPYANVIYQGRVEDTPEKRLY